jgi:CRP-like cAMP-binding protein
MNTLRDLRTRADQALFAGDYDVALHGYTTLVQTQPADLDARMRIGDTLLAMGEVQRAAEVYTAFARHATHAGYPLRALVALKVLEALEPQLGSLLGKLAELYSSESEHIGRSSRMSLANLDRPLPDGFDPNPPERSALVQQATEQGAAIDRVGAVYPQKLPPVPLFSELPADAFEAVLGALKLVRVRPGDTILEQGQPGQAFYVIARGAVRITKQNGQGEESTLARLYDGAIFGEMALISNQPRSANVRAEGDCDLLEFDRNALRAASDSVSTIARALDKFTHERLLNNLMSTAALFRPLDRRQRHDLIRRFTAHDAAAGTRIIQQGEPGKGLFVLMHGEVEVWKREGNTEHRLATLGPGEVFGEISLLQNEPATATVTAKTQCRVLFLAREYFQRLIQAVPEIRDYVENLGEERLMDTQIALADDPTSWDDSSTVVDAEDEDVVMV